MSKRLFTWLGSGVFAALLIATLLAVRIAVGSLEPTSSVTLSPWFPALLVLAAINIVFAVLQGRPLAGRRAGLMLAVVGIEVLLAGSITSAVTAPVVGTLPLQQGKATDLLLLDPPVVQVDGKALPAQAGTTTQVANGQTLHIDQLLPAVARKLNVGTNGPVDNPAVHVLLDQGRGHADTWLVARSAALSHQSFGIISLALTERSDVPPATLQPHVDVRLGTVTQTVPAQPGTYSIPGTTYSLKITDVMQHATIVKQKLVDNAKAVHVNPAVRMELTSPAGTEVHVAFSNFPQFPTFQGQGQPHSGLQVRYDSGTETMPIIGLFWLPNQHLRVQMGTHTMEAQVGKTIVTPWSGLRLTIEQIVPKALVSDTYVAAAHGPPAAEVSMDGHQTWLGSGDVTEVQGHVIQFGPQTRPMGFSVNLTKCDTTMAPGSHRPTTSASHLEIVDHGKVVPVTLEANKPLHYGGFTFQQGASDVGSVHGATSILQVTGDPAIWWKYAGAMALLLGGAFVLATRRLAPALATA